MIGRGPHHNRRRLCACFVFVLLLFRMAPLSDAASLELVQSTNFYHSTGSTYEHELWWIGERMEIDGDMSQSLFALADEADLRGTFQRDIWLAGRALSVGGIVEQSARLASRQELLIAGTIRGNLIGFSGASVQIGPDASIQGDAFIMAQTVIIEGAIDGSAAIQANRVILRGTIGDNVRIQSGDISILPGARIDGDLTYSGSRELVLDPSVRLGGELIRDTRAAHTFAPAGGSFMMHIYFLAAALIAGLLFMTLLPRYTGRAVRTVRRSFWRSTLIGAIAFILIPIAGMLLTLTLVGIPAAIIVFIVYGLLLYFSKVIVACVLGGIIMRRSGPQSFSTAALSFALGLLLLYFVTYLPTVGSMVSIAVLFIGLGGLILGVKGVDYPQSTRTTNEPQPPNEPPDIDRS